MNNLTIEDIEALRAALAAPDTSNAAILIFAGITAFAGIIFVVWWILNIKLEPVKSMQEKLDVISTAVTEMKSSLWTEESLNRLIVFQLMQYLQAHEQNCPCRKLHNQMQVNAMQQPVMQQPVMGPMQPAGMSTTQNIPTMGNNP